MQSTRVVAPRLATLDMLRSLQNQLHTGLGIDLSAFDSEAEFKAAVEQFPLGRTFSAQDLPIAPRSLAIAADEQATQWSALNFLCWKLRLTMTMTGDVFHRSFNDIKLAVRRSGMWTIYCQALIHRNIAYGPWQNAAWFNLMMEEAGQLAEKMSDTDPLLMKLWPLILQDRGLAGDLSEEQSGTAARRKLVEEILASKSVLVKGPKSSTTRWWSWMASFEHWDKEHHTRLLCLVALALNKGWTDSWEDVWRPLPEVEIGGRSGAPAGGASGEQPREEPAASDGAAASSSNSSAGLPQRSAGASLSKGSQAKDTDESREQLRRMREKTKNTLHAATRFLADINLTYNSRIVAIVCKAGYSEYCEMCQAWPPTPPPLCQGHDAICRPRAVLMDTAFRQRGMPTTPPEDRTSCRGGQGGGGGACICKAFKSAEGTLKTFVQWANGGWTKTLRETVRQCGNLEELGRAGFTVEFSKDATRHLTSMSPEVRMQDNYASTLSKLLFEWIGQRSGVFVSPRVRRSGVHNARVFLSMFCIGHRHALVRPRARIGLIVASALGPLTSQAPALCL